MWSIADDATIAALTRAVDALAGALHLPTGITARPPPRGSPRRARREGSQLNFLSVLFPAHEMTILGYHRVLQDLNGRSPDRCSPRSQSLHRRGVRPAGRPAAAGEFGMFLDGHWYRLTIRPI